MAAPIGNTCPDIDKALRKLNKARDGMEDLAHEYPESKKDIEDILYQCDEVEYILEDLRRSNATLREWGLGQEKMRNFFEEQLEKLEENV